jgi:HK97 family phage major capsid protein
MTATDALPRTAEELEDKLGDDKFVAELFANSDDAKAKRKEYFRTYARAVNTLDGGIRQQVKEETQKVFAEMMRDNGMADLGNRPDLRDVSPIDDDGMPKRPPNYTLYNKHAAGAKFDRDFESIGQLAKAVRKDGANTTGDAKTKIEALRNAFSTISPGDGGFLVPEVLRANLLRIALETAVVRGRATVIPMDSQRVPFPAIDSTTNVGSVFGGITSFWAEEGAAVNPTSAKFGRVVLDSKKHYAYAEVPRELVTDSVIAFDAFVSQVFPEAIGFFEDLKFMIGTGVGEPTGMLLPSANPAIATVAKETNQPTNSIVIQNLVKMFARMLPSSLGRAVWVASIDTFPELATMGLAVGTGGAPVWLANGGGPVGGAVATPPMTIFGRPVIFTEKAQTLGSQGDISFVDWNYYLIGDRQAMSVADSEDYKFAQDMVAYRFIQRLDGKPWIKSAITPANGGNPLSPIVQLAKRP